MINSTNADVRLIGCLKKYKIFIDTCALLEPQSDKFWVFAEPHLIAAKNQIIIPKKCVEELEKFAADPNHREHYRAKVVIGKINRRLRHGIIRIMGDPTDNFADATFNMVFAKYRVNYNLLLITHDKKLARDILRLNNSESVYGHRILVEDFNPDGSYRLVSHQLMGEEDRGRDKWPKKHFIPENEKFKLCSGIGKTDRLLTISYVPGENDLVYTADGGSIRIGRELGKGGEGNVYETNTPYVAKIFMADKCTANRAEKIRRLIAKKLNCEGVCFPVAEVFNGRKEFVGFLMPKAKGLTLQTNYTIKPLLLKNVGTKKIKMVELAITILEKIKYLHDRNIIIGDINLNNIMAVSPKEVYFVDTDSYQIEDLPCTVETPVFVPPELHAFSNRTALLRSKGNENFTLATLLFMLMLPGKAPYAQQGGEDMIKSIMEGDFSYPLGENSNKKAPKGAWGFIWSHMSYKVKEAFYNTFRKGEANNTESTRLGTDEWLKIFRYYHHLLEDGKMREQDEMSEDIFPTRPKRVSKFNYVTCRLCHQEVKEDYQESGYCKDCLRKGETYKCARCGKALVYTNYQKLIKRKDRFDICQECFNSDAAVFDRIKCADCGKTFEITNGEHRFYKGRGMSLPKRCKTCRDNKGGNSSVPQYQPPRPQPQPAEEDSFWSKLFKGLF